MIRSRFPWVWLAFCFTLAAAHRDLHAGTFTSAAQIRASAGVIAGADQEDDFGFDDEVETWQDVLAPQVVDLVLLAGFIVLALVGFFRKSVSLRYATLVVAVAYLGFVKSHLISVVDIFALLSGNLPIFKYSLVFYLLAVFTVVSTVLWGRMYCGRICAFGALTQLIDRVAPPRLRVELPARIERRARWIKYGMLAAVVAYFLVTEDIGVYRYVEPFWMFGRHGTMPLWIGLAALLVATVSVSNLYCRFLCPLGAALGVLSHLAVFRIKRWSECKTCKICEKTCEWGAIRGPRIVASECVRCDDCERLFMDREKCPHWIVIKRESERVTVSPAGQ